MTCYHCETHVKNELMALAGVSGVEVELNPKGLSKVKVDGEASDAEIREAIDEAGDYTLESISR